MKKNLFLLCLIAAGLGMLFSVLTMQTNDRPKQSEEVIVLQVIQRKTDFAYVVRPVDADERRTYYSEQELKLPMMKATTIYVNDKTILHP